MIRNSLRTLVPRLSGTRVLVIGDIIIDHFIWGAVTRISPEAPVPVVNVTREELLLGGSANVLRNIISLGGRAGLCGLVGSDPMGDRILSLVGELGATAGGVILGSRPTTVKTRVVAQGQQVVRFDREETGELSEQSLRTMVRYLEEHLLEFDAVMISDYAKGVISEQLMSSLRCLLDEAGQDIPLVVDPKPVNRHCFTGATVITPNHYEASRMSGIDIDDDKTLLAASRQIVDDIGVQAVLVTRGEAGMALVEQNKEMVTIPTMAREVYDVTGAGDTVAATLSLALASGCTMKEAAALANYAAGIVVGKAGTACVTAEELTETLP
ncbi:MAG: D-glycero-beta-D-manno-heptose-7-phosphate kinase [Desulfobulbus propionicus]|nr:MAG: D-glycero-beta-D-manno-heptose-7-phosphate kinase [Desulfobulbus propionicus]